VEQGSGAKTPEAGNFSWMYDRRNRQMFSVFVRKLQKLIFRMFVSAEQQITIRRQAHGERKPITEIWWWSPQRGPGAELLVRGSERQCPLKGEVPLVVIGSSPFLAYCTIFIVILVRSLIYIFAHVFVPVAVCTCLRIGCAPQLRCPATLPPARRRAAALCTLL